MTNMKFHIPFTISTIERLKKRAKRFEFLVKNKKPTKLRQYLENANVKIAEEEYIAICLRSFVMSFLLFIVLSSTVLFLIKSSRPLLFSFLIALVFASFLLFSQLIYPKVYNTRKINDLDKNLIPALQDMLVQLNSGIPLFNILANISSSEYGALSNEFKIAVKRINAGLFQMEVLEDLSEKNYSNFFKRTIWQISNGMRAGSDISIVIQESIKTLNEEQLLQIQNYGNKLNPLIMFYMVISVILPALSIAFLTIIASMLGLPSNATIMLFIGLLIFAILLQIMFLGMVKSLRPSLL